MTKEEAKRVAEIARTADGGCSYCAKDLIEQLCDEFPEHAETFRAVLAKEKL